jgi:hypothetical protein
MLLNAARDVPSPRLRARGALLSTVTLAKKSWGSSGLTEVCFDAVSRQMRSLSLNSRFPPHPVLQRPSPQSPLGVSSSLHPLLLPMSFEAVAGVTGACSTAFSEQGTYSQIFRMVPVMSGLCTECFSLPLVRDAIVSWAAGERTVAHLAHHEQQQQGCQQHQHGPSGEVRQALARQEQIGCATQPLPEPARVSG